MLPSPFRLMSTIGSSYRVDPDDTRRTKKTLRELGYYETPSYGITPYPDERMFQGLEDFQDDFDLYRDGIMTTDGETVEKLNEVLDFKSRLSGASAQSTVGGKTQPIPSILSGVDRELISGESTAQRDNEQLALAPVIPFIVYEIAAIFGMTVMAAYAWWISLPAEEKKRVRAQVQNSQESGAVEDANEEICERLFKIDIDTCRQIAKTRGKRAGARCYASANERYAACRRGKPREQWPPLDTWNN